MQHNAQMRIRYAVYYSITLARIVHTAQCNSENSCRNPMCFFLFCGKISLKYIGKGAIKLVLFNDVKKNTYYDSITLMLFSGELSAVKGVISASIMMGTEHNKSIMLKSGLLSEEAASSAGANDMLIGILTETGEDSACAIRAYEKIISSATSAGEVSDDDAALKPTTLDAAAKALKDANFAIVSVPGRYAADEAMKAMHKGLHVLLFSDNVSLEDEKRLKAYAVEHELLLMGPDCGTAWVNGVALGFANNVRRGSIGLAAASGTGLQEVCVIIDRLGGGISQALGTGGRDVKEEVGGKMMLAELKALEADPMTKVIGIVSKPPASSVLLEIIKLCETFTKPVVACFLGGDRSLIKGTCLKFADTLEAAAVQLVQLSKESADININEPDYSTLAQEEAAKYSSAQKYVRGLYSGGSLCYEGILLAEKVTDHVYSNISSGDYLLENVEESTGHCYIDMGEDYFTDGMPHPMIDTRLRIERLKKEALDPSVAAIVFDCVIGFGSNADPAGALANAVREARKLCPEKHTTFIASICGTDSDFQNRAAQAKKLTEAGVIVMDSNTQAGALAAEIIKALQGRELG